MKFEIWFPVFTFILGGALVMTQTWLQTRWGRVELHKSQREQFQYEKLTELLAVAGRWHGIIDRHYWSCAANYEATGAWPAGPHGEPLDATDRGEYNQLWTDLQVLMLLVHDQSLRDEIDAVRDAASHTIEATSRDDGTVAYQRETEAYLAVARRIGQLLSSNVRS